MMEAVQKTQKTAIFVLIAMRTLNHTWETLINMKCASDVTALVLCTPSVCHFAMY
jgi:hypothetical protein